MEATLLDGCNAILLIDGPPNDSSNAPISAIPVEITLRTCTVKKVHFAPLPEKHQAPYTAARISKRKKTRRTMGRTEYTGPQKDPQEANKEKNDSSESINLDSQLTNSTPTPPSSPEGAINNNNNAQPAPAQLLVVPAVPHQDVFDDEVEVPAEQVPIHEQEPPNPLPAPGPRHNQQHHQQDPAPSLRAFLRYTSEQRKVDDHREQMLRADLEKERSRREQQYERDLENMRAREQQYQRTIFLLTLCILWMAVIMFITL